MMFPIIPTLSLVASHLIPQVMPHLVVRTHLKASRVLLLPARSFPISLCRLIRWEKKLDRDRKCLLVDIIVSN
ncbi:hypothetical protein GGS24DRAFT_483668 [Hypoxylon argillaceum]|nr:hypothetical protein GGS24DRAFT_483668 [Hypoxylon argillaceum]